LVCATTWSPHAAPVLPAHLEQRVGDLPQRAAAHRVHQHREDVAVGDHGLLQALQHRRRLGAWRCVEVGQALQLALLLVLGRTRQLDGLGHRVAVRVAEGVDADDGVLAGVLEHLVVHALFLDLAALVAGFHRAQHAAALGDLLELGQHRSSTSSVSSSMMKAPWLGFSFFARPHSRLMISWIAIARRTLSRWAW
jgi:hypothetical protein